MKISVEFKSGKYTVSYGFLSATAATVHEAVDILIKRFGEEVNRMFGGK